MTECGPKLTEAQMNLARHAWSMPVIKPLDLGHMAQDFEVWQGGRKWSFSNLEAARVFADWRKKNPANVGAIIIAQVSRKIL